MEFDSGGRRRCDRRHVSKWKIGCGPVLARNNLQVPIRKRSVPAALRRRGGGPMSIRMFSATPGYLDRTRGCVALAPEYVVAQEKSVQRMWITTGNGAARTHQTAVDVPTMTSAPPGERRT